MTTPTPAARPLRPLFAALASSLASTFPERREVIRGMLACILSRSHVLLLGLPGTAKSALTRALCQAFGATYFERLLSKFSVPEELFGPISLKALEADRYERLIAGYLPTAQIAFLDEIFKANSAILNSLLTLVNERLFSNGASPISCPLVSLVGASNELPEGKELEALWDRFALRFDVAYLSSDSNMRAMLLAPEPTTGVTMTMAELEAAQAEVRAVKVTDATVDALLQLRAALKAEGIVASDRRWKAALSLAKAHAWLAGDTQTAPEDLMFLADSLWREPKERAKVARIVGQVADPVGAKAVEVLDAARELVAKVQATPATDRKAYVTAGAEALQAFKGQTTELEKLIAAAGPRSKVAVQDVRAEVNAMHNELTVAVSKAMGLRLK